MITSIIVPFEAAVRVESINIITCASKINCTVLSYGRGKNTPYRFIFPFKTAVRVKGINITVPTSNIDRAICSYGRR